MLHRWIILTLLLALSVPSAGAVAQTQQQKQQLPERQNKMASIIIDDFGNYSKGTDEMLALPYPLTVAVMPFLPHSRRDAEAAFLAGKEVIIHLPMEPLRGRKSWLGPGVISSDLSDDEIRKRVNQAIDNIPHAIGINNHMGSKITANPRIMRIVLEECKKRNLFFIDSHTNYHSIACRTAKEVGVSCMENELFLDDQHTLAHVHRQVMLIASRLEHKDSCIAIGHVGSTGHITAKALKDKLPELAKEVQIVPISKLIAGQKPNG